MNVQAMSLAFLATVAVGSIAYVFIYPMLSGEKQAESRRASVAKPEPAAKRQNEKNLRSRREQVESSLKDLEARRDKQSKVPLSARLTQAGLSWTVQKFYIFSPYSPQCSSQPDCTPAAEFSARPGLRSPRAS